MLSLKTFALFTLSATALAHPQRHWHHHGTGTGWSPKPTGGVFNVNGTDSGEFGAGSSSAVVSAITETVVPIAASTSASSAGQFFATSSPVAAQAAASSSCTTSTTTLTSMEFITMTMEGGATAPTTSTSSPVAQFQAPSSSSSTSLSVAAGGFFQKSSAAASVSIPALGGGFSSAVASVIPTTFATMASNGGASMTSGASTPTSSSTSGVSTGGKRGLSYNVASLTDAFAGKSMSWAYNWGNAPGGTVASGLEFVPMLWGLDSTSDWASAAASAISSGSTAVLSFNEPDLSSQSNISPSVAATNHIKYMNPLSGQAEIGSPAITNGAGTSPLMGIDWLNAFFTACAGNCKVDFVAFHWYADASLTDYFEQHVSDVVAAAAANGVSKVWLTEFGVTGGDATTFLNTVLPVLDANPAVEKYAYFMCGTVTDGLITGTSLNAIGEAYAA